MSAADARQIVLAIDGGNIKTDVALVAGDGHLLSLIRGGTSSPHALGFAASVDSSRALSPVPMRRRGRAATARRRQAVPPASEPVAPDRRLSRSPTSRACCWPAPTCPRRSRTSQRALGALGWAPELVVENDTLALLRTGTDRGWGVAVVCGGGINAVGIAPDGRAARFPALGAITGDWGGGHDVGVAGLVPPRAAPTGAARSLRLSTRCRSTSACARRSRLRARFISRRSRSRRSRS